MQLRLVILMSVSTRDMGDRLFAIVNNKTLEYNWGAGCSGFERRCCAPWQWGIFMEDQEKLGLLLGSLSQVCFLTLPFGLDYPGFFCVCDCRILSLCLARHLKAARGLPGIEKEKVSARPTWGSQP